MKKILSFTLVSFLLITACKKDEDKPLIILNGSSELTIELNSSWTEPGWTASDEQNGNLTEKVVVSGDTVNSNLAGTYEIVYSVSDKAGNTASRTRTVYVVNTSINRGGIYNVTDTVDVSNNTIETYQIELIPSVTVNNEVVMKNFRNKGNQSLLFIKFQGLNIITVSTQRPNMGTGFEGEVTGGGQVLGDQITIMIEYMINYDALPDKTGILHLSKI